MDPKSVGALRLMSQYSLFQKGWWLDAVAPGNWDEISIKHGDNVVARMPYVIQRKHGLTFLGKPKLTKWLGPWIAPSAGKYATILGREKDLLEQLIGCLPRFDSFNQNFHYAITNWLPFYWHGFKQTTKYTYVLDDLSDLDSIWDNFLPKIKTDVRKAENRFKLKIRDDLGIDAFLRLNNLTFERQGLTPPYSSDLVVRLHSACTAHKAGQLFFAVDEDARIHAAIFLVWDAESAYYLMSGADPALRNSGATSFLVWHAIKHAARVSLRFDFEGSMVKPVERFVRGFGARQVPFFNIQRDCHALLRLWRSVKSMR